MRQQVGALLEAFDPPLLAAPPDVLSALGNAVPDPAHRFALPAAGASPATLLHAGMGAGRWARRPFVAATLLHGHGLRWAPLFWAASLAARLPLVVTLHNLVPTLSAAERVVLRITLGRARRVICVSNAVAQSARGLTWRTVVVYNGVDTTRFAPAGLAARTLARRKLALEANDPVALCLARLSPEKNVDGFLEAARLVRDILPRARFLVAGDGPERALLADLIARRGLGDAATLLGARDDVPALLAAADVLCAPSREEGLGLAALEAMAAGLPVVAAKIGGLSEVVVENTGRLVPPNDHAGLASALVLLLNDPARSQRLGAAGRARVLAHFSVAAMLKATAAVYREAAA